MSTRSAHLATAIPSGFRAARCAGKSHINHTHMHTHSSDYSYFLSIDALPILHCAVYYKAV